MLIPLISETAKLMTTLTACFQNNAAWKNFKSEKKILNSGFIRKNNYAPGYAQIEHILLIYTLVRGISYI